ncbi:MAG TPA: hypothetical protein VFA35_08170, partial [Burkholderiaceae bacterium]|nr:hypothetical protein [Burkholderiaceae bacterium]
QVDLAGVVANGTRELEFAGGRVRVEIADEDLLAAPQTVEVLPGETKTLRFPIAIGRTRELRFNGDGRQHPEYRTPLHVVVRGAGGAVIEQQDIEALMPDLRGFRYWYLTRAYPFGRYEVEAHGETGLCYRGSFEVREDPEDPTRVDVPLAK